MHQKYKGEHTKKNDKIDNTENNFQMYEGQFKSWLISQGIDSFNTYLARINKIEEYYGDINKEYNKDGCAWLLSEFEYTQEDQDFKRAPRHRIPINPTSNKDL